MDSACELPDNRGRALRRHLLQAGGDVDFEEFRRDPEDMGVWTPVSYHSRHESPTLNAARVAAGKAVPWLASILDPQETL